MWSLKKLEQEKKRVETKIGLFNITLSKRRRQTNNQEKGCLDMQADEKKRC
jgi:hypothetical protein